MNWDTHTTLATFRIHNDKKKHSCYGSTDKKHRTDIKDYMLRDGIINPPPLVNKYITVTQ